MDFINFKVMLIPLFTVLNKANSVPKCIFEERIVGKTYILGEIKNSPQFVGEGLFIKSRSLQEIARHEKY